MGIGLNSLQYWVLYLGSHYNTGPYNINLPHFGNSNLEKLPCTFLMSLACGHGWLFVITASVELSLQQACIM